MPILIRRGGQYVRYNGKYATDIDLCDCSCDDYPPDVCCCDDMPDTITASAVIIGYASCSPDVVNEQEVEFDLTRDACEGFGELPNLPDEDSCMYGIHCGSFTSKACTIGGGVLFDRVTQVILVCSKSAVDATSLQFILWNRSEAATGSFLPWGYITSNDHPCPVETIDDWPMPTSPFKELEISL